MYTVTSIKQTCYACPSQWEGTTSTNEEVYIRFRWGCLRLDINGETQYEDEVSDGMDGCMSLEEAVGHMQNHLTLTSDCWEKYWKIDEEA